MQTSLIPTQVALARFLETSGLDGIFANYPYWYLGNVPFHYLTGPIIPSVLALLHKFLPTVSYFDFVWIILGVCWVLGGIGIYKLVGELGGLREKGELREGRLLPWLVAIFYLFGPIIPFLFRFSDGVYLMAFSLIPWVLLRYLKFLKPLKFDPLLIFLITFLILLDSQIIPTLVLGMAAMLMAESGWKRVEEKLKSSLVFLFFSFMLATLWYTPGYWWTLLGAPSFGGQGLAQVIAWLVKLLPITLALTLAVVSAKFYKGKNILRDFTFYWLFIFGFLTLIRFLSDPDFWLDWSSYGVELQLGGALALGGWLGKKLEDRRQIIENQSSVFSLQNLFSVFRVPSSIFLASYLLLFTLVFNRNVLGTLQKDITQTVEYRIGKELSGIAKPGERVFLSGTTVFWLNAFFDIAQVRGGVDQASVDADWRRNTWVIRESMNTDDTDRAIKELGISYLVVHTEDSQEYWHDFKNPEKFEAVESLRKVYEERGDIIYRVESEQINTD